MTPSDPPPSDPSPSDPVSAGPTSRGGSRADGPGEANPAGPASADQASEKAYWRANLKILAALLAVWAFSGFFLSIVFVEPLNEIKLGGFPLGFWFAQQGSIYIFIAIIFVYVVLMERLDKRFRNRGS